MDSLRYESFPGTTSSIREESRDSALCDALCFEEGASCFLGGRRQRTQFSALNSNSELPREQLKADSHC